MKTRLLIIFVVGIVIASSSAYLYDQMFDCLNPPLWIKFPRTGLDGCMKMYYDGTLPDWSKERERHAKEQAHREEMIESFSEIPEVVAFYEKYDDANVSVRDNHVSYFAGNENSFQPRMNLYYAMDNELTHMRFYCFNEGSVQYEVPQEDITHYLKNKDCTSNTLENQNTENVTKLRNSMPIPENDVPPFVKGLSKLQKAVSEDIPIGNYQFTDVVHGGGIGNGNLHITINPEITDPAEQEEIFQELVVLLGFDSFEIDFATSQQAKALCESPEVILVDGVCQKIVTDEPESFTAEQPPEWLWLAIGGMFMLGIILLIWRKRK